MKTLHLHTIDLVNHHYIEKWAAEHGYAVVLAEPRDGPPETHGQPAIVDLDFWACSPFERAAFVRKYSHTPLTQPLMVFSYNLEDEDVKKLEANGVRVFPRMDEDAIAAFLQSPEPNRERNIDRFFGHETRV